MNTLTISLVTLKVTVLESVRLPRTQLSTFLKSLARVLLPPLLRIGLTCGSRLQRELKPNKKIDQLIAEGHAKAPLSKDDPANSKELKLKYAASIFSEMKYVTWRTALAFWRKP